MNEEPMHALAETLANQLNEHINKEEIEYVKLVYGLEILLITVSKMLIIYSLSALMGVFIRTLIMHSAFVLLKQFSFGVHALKSRTCTMISIFLFVVLPYLLTDFGINNFIVTFVFLAFFYAMWQYAPADTKFNPIIGRRRRATLKKKALFCTAILMGITFFVPSQSIKLMLVMGAVYQCVSILPITYKILKRSVKNYEIYEQEGTYTG